MVDLGSLLLFHFCLNYGSNLSSNEYLEYYFRVRLQ